ncbi:MAG: anion permease, partial [bacterium]
MNNPADQKSTSHKSLAAIICGPLVAIGLSFVPTPEPLTPEAWALVGLAAWMVIWWMTEAAPVAVTALLPIPLMPLMGIAEQKAVSS